MTNQHLVRWLATLPDDWTRGVDESVIERAHAAYQSPNRHYHTWQHVVACVEQLRTVPCNRPRVVFLALLFHDAVYVAGRSDNESQSARLAHDVLRPNEAVTAEELTAIEQLILATKDHHARLGLAGPDEAALLDIDLSILAAPRDAYIRYAGQIHDEWVPLAASEAEFRIGRVAFLCRMVAAPHVYLTASGQQRWDETARANMSWELDTLRRQQGWVELIASAMQRLVAALRRRFA
jgi:predicted metal-dependent HD superfamily phosphohydrolase